MTKDILVTCPPMLNRLDKYHEKASDLNLKLFPEEVTQILSEEKLIEILPKYDGWIIGDDPATKNVFRIASKGQLKAAVKWGIGTDNVDFDSCKEYGIKIVNTPGMFNSEVADIAYGYLISLARHTTEIDRAVRKGNWLKICGTSLADKKCGLIGFGNIGKETAKRLLSSYMRVIVYDPSINSYNKDPNIELASWPERLNELDFIIVNCALTKSSYHLLNEKTFALMKDGVRIINVGRGPIIDEMALINALDSRKVHSVALDVFENEPLKVSSKLIKHTSCIFGSHNSSNTREAVDRTSIKAIELIADFLK